MANHLSDEDKYIIIGVKRKKSGDIKFQDVLEPIDQASYQQFLDSNIEPQINFEYGTSTFEGHHIAYFKIFNNTGNDAKNSWW
jgi:predicted HTH transcriptional regulator